MLRKYGLLTSTFAQSASYRRQMEEAIKFITHNPALTFAEDELKNLIMKSNSSFDTPNQKLFTHLVDSFKMGGSLPFVEIFIRASNPPEIFTSDSVCFDAREVMKDLPSKIDGPIVNLTNNVKIKSSGGRSEYILTDIMKIQGLYVRSALCASYLTSPDKQWLTPKICSFIIESYNMIISNQIRVLFHISDLFIMKKVGFVVSAFMAQMLDSEAKIGSGIPDQIYRMGSWTSSEIQGMAGELSQHGFTFNKKYTIIDLCDMIKHLGGEKLAHFGLPHMFRLFTAGTSDTAAGSITMEYPPFWVFHLLDIASGTRHPVHNNILKNGRLLDKLGSFAHDLNTTDTFIASLEN